MYTIWGLEGFVPASLPVLAAEWMPAPCLPTPLDWVLSAKLGFAGICSALAVLRGVSEEWGTLVVSYSMSTVTWNKHRFRVLGRIPMVNLWGSQRSTLAGAGFDAQLLLWSSLRRICFLVTFVSSALDARLPREFELKVSIYGFCLTCQPIFQCLYGAEGRVGSVTTWLILPVVICLSQRLSHACLSVSFYTAKLRMAH